MNANVHPNTVELQYTGNGLSDIIQYSVIKYRNVTVLCDVPSDHSVRYKPSMPSKSNMSHHCLISFFTIYHMFYVVPKLKKTRPCNSVLNRE